MTFNLEAWQQLNRAVRSGDFEQVQAIISESPELIHETSVLGSILHLAAMKGRLRIVEFLIINGADIDFLAEVGGSPLDLAASKGHAEVVKYLIDRNASLEVPKPDQNPLFSAILNGHIEIVKVLLDAGINTHAIYRNSGGSLENALTFAKSYDQLEIVELLEAAGCRLPIEGVDKPIWEAEVESSIETDDDLSRVGESDNESEAEVNSSPEVDEDESATGLSDEEWDRLLPFMKPEGEGTDADLICFTMHAFFGPVDPLSLQELLPVMENVHVAIHVIRPTQKHPYLTLFTTGMSDVAMKVPAGQEKYQYGELIMHLPPTWPHPRDAGSDVAALWPVQWLRQMAYYPHLQETWLGGPYTIVSSDEPPVPLGPNTKHTCLLLIADAGNFPPLKVGDKQIHYYTVNTLYTEERDYEKKHGWKKLFELLSNSGMGRSIDPSRKNAASP